MTATTNGQAPPAEEAGERVLGWDDLTPRDLLRAKAAKLFGDTDPQEAVEQESLYATALVIWCIRSREDPDFTWDQALDSPYGTLKVAAAVPPLAPAAASSGSTSGSKRRGSAPTTAPPTPTSAPASAPSST